MCGPVRTSAAYTFPHLYLTKLRNLCKDVLVNWTESDIDWLLAGGMQSDVVADPATSLCFNDPKQRIDYNKLVKGVDLLEEEDEQMVRL